MDLKKLKGIKCLGRLMKLIQLNDDIRTELFLLWNDIEDDFDSMKVEKSCDDEALEILQKLNPLRNDVDAYMWDIAEWGLGKREKPNLQDYGKD